MSFDNRHARRTFLAQYRLREKRIEAVDRLSFGLALGAEVFKTSRKSARRRLKAEVERRYGKATARLMGVRLISKKDLEKIEARVS